MPIYPPLEQKLCDLYENHAIFDQFNITNSPCSNYILTGGFNSNFHIMDKEGKSNTQFKVNQNMNTIKKSLAQEDMEVDLGDDYDFTNKILKTAWHPANDTIAVACLNGLYFYNKVIKQT